MSADPTPEPITHVPAEHYPQCLRCGKPVDSTVIRHKTGDQENVVVEYECHGERVTQEIAAGVLRRTEALAGCTAFNEYTTGLMPGKGED